MRRTSQSMYQSKLPNSSKLIDGSALFNGKLATTSQAFPGGRKVEGQDVFKPNKTNFEQTVNNLKNKPNQKVLEDEYINGLQEEIKYLEYELKLLKDKELIEREGVNELDNFLKDEIPINENILAMKNKYNSTKQNLDRKYKELQTNIAEAEGVLSMQKGEIERYHQAIEGHRKQVTDRKNQFQDKLSGLMKELSMTKDEYQALLEQNKKKQQAIKQMNEELAALQRKQEKERIQEVRLQEEQEKQRDKFEEQFKLKKEQLIESIRQIEQLEAHGENNPLLEPLEMENSSLRKKIMLNEKQKSTAENIISEVELFLKEEARERETERGQKAKLINEGETYRVELQHLERYVDELIKEQTIRTKFKMLKQFAINLAEKQQSYQLLVDRLRNLEQQCSNLIQQKKQLHDAIENEKNIAKQFTERENEINSSIVTNKSKTEALLRLTTQTIKDIAPTVGELEKCKGRIPIIQRDIEKKKISIHHLNKQVDLLKQLKSLDMQQLQMISNGGSNVQNVLHSFIKNWEKIKNS